MGKTEINNIKAFPNTLSLKDKIIAVNKHTKYKLVLNKVCSNLNPNVPKTKRPKNINRG